MTSQYTQLEAYKHILQVAQNIINSSQIQPEILKKYEQLKRSIVKKIIKQPKQKQHTFSSSILSVYKKLIQNNIQIIETFQNQLENNMERKNYNQMILELNDEVRIKIEDLEKGLEQKGVSGQQNKIRLLQKDEINTLKYKFDQLDTKFENLGLLIEVHKKMHQIIQQATKTQQKRFNLDQNYKQQIKRLQEKVSHVQNIDLYINQHKFTDQTYKKYKKSTKILKQLLLDFNSQPSVEINQ